LLPVKSFTAYGTRFCQPSRRRPSLRSMPHRGACGVRAAGSRPARRRCPPK
jgi:hypothetical protein